MVTIQSLLRAFLVGCAGSLACGGHAATGMAQVNEADASAPAKTFVGLAVNSPDGWAGSPAGDAADTQTLDLAFSVGAHGFFVPLVWSSLEPRPGSYDFSSADYAAGHSSLDHALSLVARDLGTVRLVLMVKPIDMTQRTMPQDLAGLPFDSPQVIARFQALLSAMTAELGAAKAAISHVVIGNEVSTYFMQNPQNQTEVSAWSTLLESAADTIHKTLPGAKVGTVVTFDAAKNQPALVDQIDAECDFVDFTYYPVDYSTWQVEPVSSVAGDVKTMADRAGKRGFSFTEIGYSGATVNGSSEQQYTDFWHDLLQATRSYGQGGQLDFLFAVLYGDIQATTPRDAFYGGVGLRYFATGQPRPAWDVFRAGISGWTR